jgi:hypothetical protein
VPVQVCEAGAHDPGRLAGDGGLGLLGGTVAGTLRCLAEARVLALVLGGDQVLNDRKLASSCDGRAVAAAERERDPRVRPSGDVQAGQLGVRAAAV